MKTRVLVTCVGSPAARSIIQSLDTVDYIDLYGSDSEAISLFDANVDVMFHNLPLDHPQYAEQMYNFCRDTNIKFLFPVFDKEIRILNKYQEDFDAIGTQVICESQGTMDVLGNKLLTYFLYRRTDVPTLKTYWFESKSPPFGPYIVKSTEQESGEAVKTIRYRNYMTYHNDPSKILQNPVEGDVYVVDMLAEFAVCRKVIDPGVRYPKRFITESHDEILDIVKKIKASIDIKYMVHADFIVTDEGPFLLSVNPRPSSSLIHTTAAGLNMPKAIIDALSGQEIDSFKLKEGLVMNRSFVETFAPQEDINAIFEQMDDVDDLATL